MCNLSESGKVSVKSLKVGDTLRLKNYLTNAKHVSYCDKLSCVSCINSDSNNDG